MQHSTWKSALGLTAVLVATGCGGGATGPGKGGGGGAFGMTAKVDGVDWAPTIQASGAHVVPGSYILTGLSTASGGSSMTFSLSNIGDTGTYALGMGPSGFGGTVQWVKGSAGWVTPLSGVAGTIHITALSDTHMTGTFAFTADHLTGGATGTVHVTGGTFDAPVTTSGNPGPLPDRSGSRITADVDGAVFNAATTAVTLVIWMEPESPATPPHRLKLVPSKVLYVRVRSGERLTSYWPAPCSP